LAIRSVTLLEALRHDLRYLEEQAGFVLPVEYIKLLSSEEKPRGDLLPATIQPDILSEEGDIEALAVMRTKSCAETTLYSNERFEIEQQLALERTKTIPIAPKKTNDGVVLVDWYAADDPVNPQNVSENVFRPLLPC
jgi:DHA1 family multidrug resistance protein-like MFS transporter